MTDKDNNNNNNDPPEVSTPREEEAAPAGEQGTGPRTFCRSFCYPFCCCCGSCCQLRILPYGLLRWSLATVATVIALAITLLADGTCYFIKSEVNDPALGLVTGYKIGINRYKDEDGSCEVYHDGTAKDLVYQSVYWEVVRYFCDIGVIILFLFTLLVVTTGLLEYKCAGRTFFAKLAVCMAAMNTLHMASFLVFASDICTGPSSKCFLGDGAFLMMGAIVAWWIAGWLVLHMIPLGQQGSGGDDAHNESLHLPSRWRSLYVEVCGATVVAAAAVNGAIIAAERRD